MLPTPRRAGVLSALWRMIPKPTDRYLVGTDLQGNRFYEKPSTTDDPRRTKRSVAYREKRYLSDYGQDLPVQWTAWLAHTRRNPPTHEELQADLLRIARTRANAERLAIAYAEEKARRLALQVPTAPPSPSAKWPAEEVVPDTLRAPAERPGAEEAKAGAEGQEEKEGGKFSEDEMEVRERELERRREAMRQSPLAAFRPPESGEPQAWTPTVGRRRG